MTAFPKCGINSHNNIYYEIKSKLKKFLPKSIHLTKKPFTRLPMSYNFVSDTLGFSCSFFQSNPTRSTSLSRPSAFRGYFVFIARSVTTLQPLLYVALECNFNKDMNILLRIQVLANQ